MATSDADKPARAARGAKYMVEFIGTFFLVFTIGMSVIEPGAGALAPLAIGLALMVMVYAGGHVSGAHYNPAVTLAATIRGAAPPGEFLPYVAVQILGGLLASVAVGLVKGDAVMASVMAMDQAVGPVLIVEFLFTFALCWVILHVATAEGTAGNSFYGLAIGMTVAVGAFSVGSVSGAVFNPAVAVGVSLMGLSSWGAIWMYLVANFAAGVVAAIVFAATNPAKS